jgi:hypothetical protein
MASFFLIIKLYSLKQNIMNIESDIRIVYLKLLHREPSLSEITSARSKDLLVLEYEIKSSNEYQILKGFFFADYSFDTSTNTYSFSNVRNNKNERGLYLANDYLNMYISSYNQSTENKLSDNFEYYDFQNITHLEFSVSNLINETQKIFLNEAYIEQKIEFDELDIVIEKYCFHSFKTCFLQKLNIIPHQTMDLDLKHIFKSKMNSFVLYYNGHSVNFSEVDDEDTLITNMYKFENTEILYKGHTFNENVFTIPLIANENQVFYIYSSILHKDNRKEHNNTEILLNLLNFSISELISGHQTCWDRRWQKRYDFAIREHVSDKKNVDKMVFVFQYSLYKLYSNIYVNDLFYSVPSLLILDPELALQVLQSYIYIMRNDFNTAKYYSKDGKFLSFEKQNIGLQINQSALLNIHIWNYYVISKNINWLLIEGYPTMLLNARFLMNCIQDDSIVNALSIDGHQQTNNAFTIHITKMALNMTTIAQYEFIIFKIFDGSVPQEFNEEAYNFTTGLTVNYTKLGHKTTSDSNLHVKCEIKDHLLSYTFYNETNDFLGYKFSKQFGYQLELGPNRQITFNLDESVSKKPILFYDNAGLILRHKYSNTIDETLLSDVSVVSSDDSITVNTNDIRGYSCLSKDVYSMDFNTLYGDDAFVPEYVDVQSNNIVIPYSNYDTSNKLSSSELFILLSNYYNTKKEPYNYNLTDNLTYFDKDPDLIESSLLRTGLYLKLAQDTDKYQAYSCYTNMYKKTNFKVNENKVLGADYHHNIILYNTLFNLIGFKLSSTEGIIYNTTNIFPEDLYSISFKNYYHDITLLNSNIQSYTYLDLIDVIKLDFRYNEKINEVIILPDILNNYPIYTKNDIAIMIHKEQKDEIYFDNNVNTNNVISYTRRNEIYDTITYIDELTNVYAHVKLENTESSNFIVKFYENISDTITSSMIYPTIEVFLNYENTTVFNLLLRYSSQNQNKYDVFSNLEIFIEYDDTLLKKSSVNIPYGFDTQSNCSINLVGESGYKINFISDPIAGELDIGKLKLELIEYEVFTRIAPIFPFSGYVSNGQTNKQIIFDQVNYPPVIRQLMLDSLYFMNRYVIETEESKDLIDNRIRIPIEHVLSSGNNIYEQLGHGHKDTSLNGDYVRINENIKTNLRPLNNANELNAFLILNNQSVVDIISSKNSTLFKLINNTTKQVELYGIGQNTNDLLMIGDISNTDVVEITRCEKFHSFLSAHGYKIEDFEIKQTIGATLLYSKDKVYAIGKNDQNNLGLEVELTNEILESVRIRNLLLQENSRINEIILNNESTFIHLQNNKMFGLGESVMFQYITTVSPSIWLNTPTELDVINDFVNTNDYVIERIEGGNLHLKFLLISLKTHAKEWWGIGRNRFNSMGLNPLTTEDDYDIDIKHMVRLDQIESFIYGTRYDETYTGVSAKNEHRAHLISNRGSPTHHIAMYDEELQDIFVLGAISLNESESEITTIKEWTKWVSKDDIQQITNEDELTTYMLALNDQGLFIGLSRALTYNSKFENNYVQSIIVDKGDNYVLNKQNTLINVLRGKVIVYNFIDLSTSDKKFSFDVEYEENMIIYLDTIRVEFENIENTQYSMSVLLSVIDNTVMFEAKRDIHSDINNFSFEIEYKKAYLIKYDTYEIIEHVETPLYEQKIILENRLVFKNYTSI